MIPAKHQNKIFLAAALLAMSTAVLLYLFLDLPVARYFMTINGGTKETFAFITKLGQADIYLIPAFLFFIFYRKRNLLLSRRALYLFCVVATAGLFVDIVKVISGRFRPTLYFSNGWYGFDFFRLQSDYLSFPSGHSATAIGVAVALGTIYPAIRYPLLAVALCISASRVIISSHYMSDVLVGSLIGGITAAFLYRLYFRQLLIESQPAKS